MNKNAALFGEMSDSDSSSSLTDHNHDDELVNEYGIISAQTDFAENDSGDNQDISNENSMAVEGEEQISSTVACEFPILPSVKNTDVPVYLCNVPNFIAVEPFPFDGDNYEPDEDNEDFLVENTIRWRFVKSSSSAEENQQNPHSITAQKESNARFVKWSDGSMSLLIGNELFDVNINNLRDTHQYLFSPTVDGYLQAQMKLEAAMAFKPLSTASRTHQKLTATVLQKHQKVKKTKFIGSLNNPEANKIALEKAEQEAIRNRKRLEAQRRNRSGGRYSGNGGGELTVDDLEEEEDMEILQRRKAARERGEVSADQDEEYDEDFVVDDDHIDYEEDEDDEEEEEEDNEEESEEEGHQKRGLERADGSGISQNMDLDGNDEGDRPDPKRKEDRKKKVVLSDDE